MTVGELITALQALPEEAKGYQVVTRYDGTYVQLEAPVIRQRASDWEQSAWSCVGDAEQIVEL